MQPTPKKTTPRFQRRENVIRGRLAKLERLFSNLDYELPDMEMHERVVQNALLTSRIDWSQVNPSIIYLERYFSEMKKINREGAKRARSCIRASRVLPQRTIDAFVKIKELTNEFGSTLQRIKARRKAETGR